MGILTIKGPNVCMNLTEHLLHTKCLMVPSYTKAALSTILLMPQNWGDFSKFITHAHGNE